MAKIYSFSAARRHFSALIEQGQVEGGVRVKHRNGRMFVIRVTAATRSPLDVASVDLGLSLDELLDALHESRGESPSLPVKRT